MPTLVTIPFSHFCEKARWALDHAGVRFQEEGHVPGLHRRAVRRASGRSGSVPVLVLDDGTALADSPLIVEWADRQAGAGRKLLPEGGAVRDEARAFERKLDVGFAPHIRRLAYYHLLPDRSRMLRAMAIATPAGEQSIVRLVFPLLRMVMRASMRIDARHAARSRDRIHQVFEEVGQRLSDGRPFLLGDTFSVADLAFAAFSAPLLAPVEHPYGSRTVEQMPEGLAAEARALRETAAGRFTLRMYSERRQRTPNAEPEKRAGMEGPLAP